MASYVEGYSQDRFQASVDKNFFCPICTEVLKDPVQCHNQHYFCTGCITRHIHQNGETCPMCMEKLTEEDLAKPPRIVTDYLNGLLINCDYTEKGCTEMVALEALKTHVAECIYRPVVCSNERCTETVNMKDLDEHMTTLCEYRLIHCHECDEKMSGKKYGKHACLLRKEVDEMKTLLFDIKQHVTKIQDTQNSKFEDVLAAIQNLALCSPLVQAEADFPSSGRQYLGKNNILVFGGMNYRRTLDSVEMYSCISHSWKPLAPMTERRASATAHYYNGQILVTGGHNNWASSDNTERMVLGEVPDHWYPFPLQLPEKCCGHKTLIHNGYLWTVGGSLHYGICSKKISKVSLLPPYSLSLEGELPQPVSYHCLEVVGDEIMIIGGSTTGFVQNLVNTVLSYNMVTKKVVQMSPLPFPMADMASVCIGEEVLIIGGSNKQSESLDTVFKYNHKTMQCTQLPSMKYKRAECAAVVSGNKVFVMGGNDNRVGFHNSVECFDLNDQFWMELPPMKEARNKLAAVCVPAHVLQSFCS